MSLLFLLAPIALAFPALGDGRGMEPPARPMEEPTALVDLPDPGSGEDTVGKGSILHEVLEAYRSSSQEQVRIEQRMTIRIVPRPVPAPPMMFDFPDHDMAPRFVERSIGRCLPVGAIAGVQAESGNRLLLFMRDRRIVSAALERACRARDFYSGFYLQRSTDGQLCVDRDALQSRNGVNCKITRLRQLIELDD